MRNPRRPRPHLARVLTSGWLVLVLPLCLAAGTPAVAIAAADTCQPEAVASDFCSKFTTHSDVAAVLPEALVYVDGTGLTPQPLLTLDTLAHPLPGYLTTPSGRSPPLG